MTVTIDFQALRHFTCTTQHFRHWAVSDQVFRYTDGVQYLGANGCGWLLDKIALSQLKPHVKREEFQVWKLIVNLENSTAVLELSNGNNRIVEIEQIDYTDFPRTELIIWVEGGVAHLPSEH